MPILILFAMCWSGICLLMDSSIGHGFYKQFESGKFPSVTGTITHSELQTHTSSKGTSYTAVVNYLYKVNGKTFMGDTLAFSEDEPGIPQQTIVSSHPVGSAVQVYYNPTDANESLLYPGVVNDDMAWALFLLPFNVIMIGFWTWIAGWLRLRLFRPIAGGVKIISDGAATRVRLPKWEAIWWALGTTGGLAFALTFVVGFGSKVYPFMGFAAPLAGLVVLAGIGVYLWRCLKAMSGDEDLVIDEASGTLNLPPTFRRAQRVTVAFSEIEAVWVETIVNRAGNGTSYTFAPTLNMRGQRGHTANQRLAEWSDKLKADKFAEWLREKTRVASRVM